jgi:hypothetical protein
MYSIINLRAQDFLFISTFAGISPLAAQQFVFYLLIAFARPSKWGYTGFRIDPYAYLSAWFFRFTSFLKFMKRGVYMYSLYLMYL